MPITRLHLTLPLAIAVLALAACGGGDSPDKAGGSGPTVTLRIGSANFPNSAATDAMATFAREVETLSDRKLRIKLVWKAAGMARAWDQRVARRVIAGDLDLGLIPARAWDTEGVTSMRAIHAPFLVTNDELAREVVQGELAEEMLAGLDELDLVGLALIPEGLRHPVGFGKPLLSPADYSGIMIQTPRSDTGYALFRALGATPQDFNGDGYQRAVRSGAVQGEDLSFVLAKTLLRAGVFTGNVTFSAKVNSLVVNREVYEGLTEEQRSTLREAAERTREHGLDEDVREQEAAARFCADGGTVVTASEADLQALEQAAEPVYAELEKDTTTREMIDRIRELKQRQPPSDEVEPCAGGDSAADRSPSSDPGADGRGIPNGVYRTQVTEAELLKAGLPRDEEEYDGVHTLTLEDGEFVDELRRDTPIPDCLGSYTSSATTVELRFETECTGNMSAHWSLRDGHLRFTRIGSSEDPSGIPILRAVFGSKPFKKID